MSMQKEGLIMKTTLVTALGSASASTVLDALHEAGHRVVGCDIYPREWNLASCQADVFFQAVPATDAQAYLAQLLNMVKREQVSYLIPLTDVEVDVLCGQKARFAALGCIVCTPDEAAARLCRNKQAMTEALAADHICATIPTRSPYGWAPGEADFPMMLKRLHGRSSQGQAVVHTRQAFDSVLLTSADYIAQPFIAGAVYTVDVARDALGHVQALTRQELLRTVNGLGTTVRILPGHPLEAICARIAERANIVGVVNMEFIGHQDDFYFLEVNPRFSGGVGFSALAGLSFPALSLSCYDGAAIGPRPEVCEMTLTQCVGRVRTDGR